MGVCVGVFLEQASAPVSNSQEDAEISRNAKRVYRVLLGPTGVPSQTLPRRPDAPSQGFSAPAPHGVLSYGGHVHRKISPMTSKQHGRTRQLLRGTRRMTDAWTLGGTVRGSVVSQPGAHVCLRILGGWKCLEVLPLCSDHSFLSYDEDGNHVRTSEIESSD